MYKSFSFFLPVLLSPESLRSALVFVYEKPTPAGDSRKRIFASASAVRGNSNFCNSVKSKYLHAWGFDRFSFHLPLFHEYLFR